MSPSSKTPPVALTIAGSDSSGGAGIQADLKTFAALKVYGTSAISAITAQNTNGVDKVQILLPDMVEAQVQAVTSDMFVRATKVGMLGSFENVALVARMIDEGTIEKVVVDPVMVATSGDRLMNLGVDKSYIELILPRTFILTPNLTEAQTLLRAEISSVEQLTEAAFALCSMGPKYVLLKGGHLDSNESIDILCDGKSAHQLKSRKISTENTHGTGCTLSSAVAASLAKGQDVLTAVKNAKIYVTRSIEGGSHWAIGKGNGPLDHFGWSVEDH